MEQTAVDKEGNDADRSAFCQALIKVWCPSIFLTYSDAVCKALKRLPRHAAVYHQGLHFG